MRSEEPETGDTAGERYRAPALDKGLDILELLSTRAGGLTRSEIVRALGKGPSEVYRMLERLVARDYVARSPEGDRYALTLKLFVLAHRHPPVRRLAAGAQPLMDAFAVASHQSCHLVAIEGDKAVVVARAVSSDQFEFGVRVGTALDLLQSASGQMLLAFADAAMRDACEAQWAGGEREHSWRDLGSELAQARAEGYRITPSRRTFGIEDICVPIRSPDGSAVAVLTCPFIRRLDKEHPSLDTTLALLRGVAVDLSLR